MNFANMTLEVLRRMQVDIADIRREQTCMAVQMATMQKHLAANQLETARLSGDMAQVKGDVSLIKKRLDLVDA